jgi:hypothetical protein
MNAARRSRKLRSLNFYDELIKLRDQHRKREKQAVFLVKGDELPWEINPQGKMRWYLHPSIDDTVIQTLIVYLQEIPAASSSGKQKCQGGTVIYVVEGKGHTVIDDVSYSWETDDVVQLPIRPDGIVFQHFNDDPHRPAQLICAEPNLLPIMGVDRGSGFEQLSAAPEYKGS